LGIANDTVVANCLIDMYGKCGSVEYAVSVFSDITDKDVISWNSVIAACANNGNVGLGFKFLKLMPNPDAISYNGLINGIAQAGKIEDAVWILSTMPCPNSSSWNSVITGFVNRNRIHEALDMFRKMQLRNLQMDEFTFSIILNGIAGLSVLTWGMLIHCCTIKYGLDSSVVVGTALIDMYSKCGRVNDAEFIFNVLPNRNLVSWNAMISGYARNGDFVQVISLFELLKMERDTKPDGVTFLNLISACSHTQIPFEAAIRYFDAMINEYGIAPSIEHCCSVIRLMGQKGELQRAQRMIQELGFESCGVVWRSLLGACGTQEDLQVAEVAASKVIELERDEDYVYVMLSNMYASFGRWEDVNVIRSLMSKKRVRKEAGSSWIEVNR
jgi:pentatricopeptide repeat protein